MKTPILLALALVLALTFVLPTTTAAQGCAFPQTDMAGLYLGSPALMSVELTDCGGMTVVWSNPYGYHRAMYASTERVPGGGISAVGFVADPRVGWLDNTYEILVKPAELGYVQLFTSRGYYRLQKVR
jgi:hypothetical protein